nr:MAG TPA: hypothetical protein [Caudoviricetes sp.]
MFYLIDKTRIPSDAIMSRVSTRLIPIYTAYLRQ